VLGQHEAARRLRTEAADLRQRFNRDFWQPEAQLLALALDGSDRPAIVMSSNAGQVLATGILRREYAEAVCGSLFVNDMFTGWGIRTLSSRSPSYYPLGYHVGTVWPHDNAVIAGGLKRYDFDAEADEVMTALFDASREFPMRRLPELFGGEPRRAERPPIPYPVACRPQAWTAGVFHHMLAACLGLRPDAPAQSLDVVRPRLPHWLQQVHIQGLRVGSGSVDLSFRRSGRDVKLEVGEAQGVRVRRVQQGPFAPGL
jgi:glycogen debranching enzyme